MKRPSTPFRNWHLGQLRWVLGISFLLLAVPTLVLSVKAREQLKWEALYQQRQLAEELTRQIDNNLQAWLIREARRPTEEYNFLMSVANGAYSQRSPLSQWPDEYAPPGLIGYFQVDQNGQLATPLLPALNQKPDTGEASVLPPEQIESRKAIKEQLTQLLRSQQLLTPRESDDTRQATEERAPDNFSKLAKKQAEKGPHQKLGSLSDLQLERSFAEAEADFVPEAKSRSFSQPKPQAAFSASSSSSNQLEAEVAEKISPEADHNTKQERSITLFAGNSSPLSLALLDSGHLLLFRYAWHNNQRLIQGLVLEQDRFLQQSIEDAYRQSNLAQTSNLVVAVQGEVLTILRPESTHSYSERSSISAQDVSGTLLLQTTLSAPLTSLELVFSAKRLPEGPGGNVVIWASIILIVLLVVIFVLLYRMGMKQIQLFQQQQNFIASVSHELKTPLTSIRMFSEMLKAGWTPEEKKQDYYHFISAESERLSRLITNVLQLARMERQELALNCETIPVKELVQIIQSRVQSQLNDSEFSLETQLQGIRDEDKIDADKDAVLQIMMNLVDNSLKFASGAKRKIIELHVSLTGNSIVFGIRDYGPGIPIAERTRVFDLFYRIGNELTRSTQGTGIGLSLVHQLVTAMHGEIESWSLEQGAGFRITFPCTTNSDSH